MTQVYDFAVIGGGIVGLATAMKLLAERPGASLVVLEKEDGVARHQTGHNSGVIHAGIYYKPGSHKAILCKEGAQRTRQFCDEHGIGYRNTGKLIVATNDAELERMNALYERALLNELDVEKIDAAELRRREPNITGVGAIWLTTTGIVDYRQVCAKMAEVIESAGGTIRLGAQVVDITESLSEVRIDVAPLGVPSARPGTPSASTPSSSSSAAASRPTAWRRWPGSTSTSRWCPSAGSTTGSRRARTPSSTRSSTPCRTPRCPSSACTSRS